MANSFQALAQTLFKGDTIRPQSITGNTNGVAVDVTGAGTNFLTALLSVGAVSSLTSLDVKIQASTDGSTGWTDITGATFTTVTAASQLQAIDFQLPTAASATANPYTYVRAVVTISGTSALTYVTILGFLDSSGSAAYQNSPPTIN